MTTLFADDELDSPRIVREQKELNMVMMYSTTEFPAIPSLLSASINRLFILLGLAQEPTWYRVSFNHNILVSLKTLRTPLQRNS